MKKVVKKKSKKVASMSFLKLKARGVSKVVVIAVVAVVLVGAGAFFFFTQQNGKAGSSALPFVKAPLNPNCELKDAELCKFVNNWKVQQNYTIMSTSKMGGSTSEYTMQFAGEGKSHMILKQDGKEQSNVITLGDTMYTLDYKDNKWWKITNKPTETKETSPVNEVKDAVKFDDKETKDNTVYKFIDKEACGDLICFKYEIVDSSNSDGSKQFIFFDDRDYLMRKMRMESANGEFSESTFNYDAVNVTAPSPVKEGTPESMSGAGGYNQAEVNKMMQEYKDNQNANGDTAPADQQPPADDTSNGGY